MKPITWNLKEWLKRRPTWKQVIEKWFLRIRDIGSNVSSVWKGWAVITAHQGIFDDTMTLGVKQYRDGIMYGAYARISETLWPDLTSWDKLAILRVLRDRARPIAEATEPEASMIEFTDHGWGSYPSEPVSLERALR